MSSKASGAGNWLFKIDLGQFEFYLASLVEFSAIIKREVGNVMLLGEKKRIYFYLLLIAGLA